MQSSSTVALLSIWKVLEGGGRMRSAGDGESLVDRKALAGSHVIGTQERKNLG